jgi:DNA segregation ATPase FtsK/SpoIIIE, S-DNA-T family
MSTSGKNSKQKRSAKDKLQEQAETELPKRWDGMRLIFGLLSLALAVYTFISLSSYLFTWAEDQSMIQSDILFSTHTDVSNQGGKVGLVWANFLVTRLFGLGAFIIPFFFLGVSLFCLRLKTVRLAKLLFTSIFGCIIISIAFSFIFSFTPFDALFGGGAGGSYGHFINEWLISMIGTSGATAILIIATLIWLISINSKFVAKFFGWIAKLKTPKEKGVKSEAENAVDTETSITGKESDTANNMNIAETTNADAIVADGADIPDQSKPYEFENPDETEQPVTNENEPEFEIIPSENPTDHSITETEEDSAMETIPEKEDDQEDGNFLDTLTEEEQNALFDPRLDLSSYQAPPISLLEEYRDKWFEVSRDELEKNNRQIVKTLNNYKIGVSKISARIGPTVTLYEIVPAPGVRVSQIKRLEEDIQLSLAARGVRVVTLVGTNAIGIEVANEKPSTVSMRSVLEDPKFKEAKYDLPVAIGKTITNEVYSFDLAKMPHLLVAGATGQGKSVGLNAILASLLYRKHPSELKLVLVDPKKVELSLYSKLEKHFLAQLPDAEDAVITDTQKVIYTLKSLCKEMDSRYDLLKMANVRNIKEYNEKFLQRKLNPQRGHRYLPYIVVVIDEFSDMIMTAGREIEEPIARLAQLARAIGIHLVIATQRPTTSVITGNIKANFPARIAFMVRSSIDSRTILDEVGANQLIGRGDMLISNGNELTRVQCAFIDTKEVENIVDFISNQRGYTSPYLLPEYEGEEGDNGSSSVGAVDLNRRDPLFEDAAKLIVLHQQGSTSLIQRKMNLGYNRAGRIMDQLEVAGIVGPFEGSKARQVLVTDLTDLDARLANLKDIYG